MAQRISNIRCRIDASFPRDTPAEFRNAVATVINVSDLPYSTAPTDRTVACLIWGVLGHELLTFSEGQMFVNRGGANMATTCAVPEEVASLLEETLLAAAGICFLMGEAQQEVQNFAWGAKGVDRNEDAIRAAAPSVAGVTTSIGALRNFAAKRDCLFEQVYSKKAEKVWAHWADRAGDFLMKYTGYIVAKLDKDDFRTSFAEWCSTPKPPARPSGLDFSDYNLAEDGTIRERPRKNNCYRYLDYPLDQSIEDPVLKSNVDMLIKFLSSHHWGNLAGMQLMLAAETLALRGLRVPKMLFHFDAGGLGKGVRSSIRSTAMGSMHVFADPDIYFTKEEARKQLPFVQGCFITHQEMAQTQNAFFGHIWRKIITGERIAARAPYAKATIGYSFNDATL